MENINVLDEVTFQTMMYALVKGVRNGQNHLYFRKTREELGVTRETLIPGEFAVSLLAYRKAEYDPRDKGANGKFSEVAERIVYRAEKGYPIRWNDYSAHRPGRADLKYGRKSVEKKTGEGNWLDSTQHSTPAGIIREYARKTTLIHLERLDRGIDITCQWKELLEYMGHYRRTAKGPEMGLEYWFKKKVNRSDDGDRWILQIQNWLESGKKVKYLRRCPFNTADWQALEAQENTKEE